MSYASALSRGPIGNETGVTSQSPAPQEKKQPQKPAEKGVSKGKQEQKSQNAQKDGSSDTIASNQQQAKGAKPKQANNKPQAKTQPAVKLEGNGGGDFKALTLAFEHPGDKGKGAKGGQKKRFSKPLSLRGILLRLGTPSAFLLGVTCKAFAHVSSQT
jgi:outer membrane biosynthesis protein TonB